MVVMVQVVLQVGYLTLKAIECQVETNPRHDVRHGDEKQDGVQ
jgi:hypothetical protein